MAWSSDALLHRFYRRQWWQELLVPPGHGCLIRINSFKILINFWQVEGNSCFDRWCYFSAGLFRLVNHFKISAYDWFIDGLIVYLVKLKCIAFLMYLIKHIYLFFKVNVFDFAHVWEVFPELIVSFECLSKPFAIYCDTRTRFWNASEWCCAWSFGENIL